MIGEGRTQAEPRRATRGHNHDGTEREKGHLIEWWAGGHMEHPTLYASEDHREIRHAPQPGRHDCQLEVAPVNLAGQPMRVVVTRPEQSVECPAS
jgi:hypothetical protein